MNKDFILIKDLFRNTDKYVNTSVKVSGWVKTLRDSKTFGFIELNDGSFFKNVQVVFNDSLSNFEDIRKLSISSSILNISSLSLPLPRSVNSFIYLFKQLLKSTKNS